MRLREIEIESMTYGENNCYTAIFTCTPIEANYLKSRARADYKAVIKGEPEPFFYKDFNLNTKKDIKVIFNPPATILFMDGKKYVSKAHDEEFDEEKGLLMCLAKANGKSHLDLKRMIKNATRQYSLQDKKMREEMNKIKNTVREVGDNIAQGIADILNKEKIE